jgi:methylmalonyl-CoA/ethylmalonyl-CoA epimerase
MNDSEICNWFGGDATFHHVAVAVASIEDCGFAAIRVFEDPIQNVSVAFLECGGCRIELVAPRSTEGPVSGALKRRQKLLHMCFEVEDLDKSIAFATSRGFTCLADPVPAIAFGGRRIAWLYERQYGLFELLERPPLKEDHAS